jgi:hypothetical protein
VAAFVKRLSRLCLTGPANALLMVLPFIGNLLLRHKGLTDMINRDQCYKTFRWWSLMFLNNNCQLKTFLALSQIFLYVQKAHSRGGALLTLTFKY